GLSRRPPDLRLRKGFEPGIRGSAADLPRRRRVSTRSCGCLLSRPENEEADLRAPARGTLDLHLAAHPLGAFAEARHPVAAGPPPGGDETHPVVADAEEGALLALREHDLHRAGLGVAPDVVERLLEHPEERELGLGRKGRRLALD